MTTEDPLLFPGIITRLVELGHNPDCCSFARNFLEIEVRNPYPGEVCGGCGTFAMNRENALKHKELVEIHTEEKKKKREAKLLRHGIVSSGTLGSFYQLYAFLVKSCG